MKTIFVRDEREATVDRDGDRVAYLVLSFGLLGIVAWRAFANDQASWELLGLVILSGLVGAAYRMANGVLTARAVAVVGVTMAVAAIVAIVIRVVVPL